MMLAHSPLHQWAVLVRGLDVEFFSTTYSQAFGEPPFPPPHMICYLTQVFLRSFVVPVQLPLQVGAGRNG